MLPFPFLHFFVRQRSLDSAAALHSSVPAFAGKGHIQTIFFAVNYFKVILVTAWYLYGMDSFSAAVPAGIVFEYQSFTFSCNFVLKGKPCHVENNKASSLFQKTVNLRRKRQVVKVGKALTGGDNIKVAFGKIELFSRHCAVPYISTHRQLFGVFYLIFRDIRCRPFRAQMIHIPRNNSRAGTDIQNPLTFKA